jgi:hypothetical protein
MLVNVSHYTNVQEQVVDILHTWLTQVQQDVRNYSQLDSRNALRNQNLADLKKAWELEFCDSEFTWEQIQTELIEGILPISVRAVNQRSGAASLDFSRHKETGLRVIVVGGNSLSRGLTLEGLSTSYFFRSTKMYDTLLQMGRWFGYRDGYEDLCRIWLSDEAAHWYAHITSATDELRQELRKMREERRRPIDFGLKVRAHPGALIVTAQNKMRRSTLIERVVSVSGESLETTHLKTNENVIRANRIVVEEFIRKIGNAGISQSTSGLDNPLWTGVPKQLIADLLRSFSVDPANISFQAKDLANFVEGATDEFLQEWDVVLPHGEGGNSLIGGVSVRRNRRKVQVQVDVGSVLVSGKSARVASRGIEREGMPESLVSNLSADFRRQNPGKSIPDKIFRMVRPRPLLLIHFIQPASNTTDSASLPDELIALGLSFMTFDDSAVAKRVIYRINLVELRTGEEVDDEEELEREDDDDLD